jgi:hypothetical protein
VAGFAKRQISMSPRWGAASIRDTEHRQIKAMETGRSLRNQLRLNEYMARPERDASYSFRAHVKDIEAAGEE